MLTWYVVKTFTAVLVAAMRPKRSNERTVGRVEGLVR